MQSDTSKSPVNVWYLTRYLRSYRWLVIFTMIFLVAGRITSSLDPIWLKKIIDGVGQGDTLAGLVPIILFYFGLRITSFVFDFLRDVLFAPAEMGIARTLSQELFDHLLTLPISYHHDQKIGGVSRKITRG